MVKVHDLNEVRLDKIKLINFFGKQQEYVVYIFMEQHAHHGILLQHW